MIRKFLPAEPLRPFVSHLAVIETITGDRYRVLPSTGVVMGFQYSGGLTLNNGALELRLANAGITGLSDCYRDFGSMPGTGSVLVYFTVAGLAQFTSLPGHELCCLSISLDNVFDKTKVNEVGARLTEAGTDEERVGVVEQFLLANFRHAQSDRLINEAVRIIYESKGSIRMKALQQRLYTSASPFEKRFRKAIGIAPKKFASIVRFNCILDDIGKAGSFADLGYEHDFFDPAHFSHEFTRQAGETPEQFLRQRQ